MTMFPFLWLNNIVCISVCACIDIVHMFIIHSYVSGYVLALLNKAAVHMDMNIPF